MSNSTTKRCSKCGKVFIRTREYFYGDKRASDGLVSCCKQCYNVGQRLSYEKCKQRRIQKNEAWRKNNPKKVQEIQKRSKAKRAIQIKAYNAEYHALHRDELNRKAREKQRLSPGSRSKPETMYLATLNYRARKRQLPNDFKESDYIFALKYFQNQCAVCRTDLKPRQRIAMDHWIPLSSPNCPGTIAENLVPLCHGRDGCNNSKGNRDPHTWLLWRYGEGDALKIENAIAEFFGKVKKLRCR